MTQTQKIMQLLKNNKCDILKVFENNQAIHIFHTNYNHKLGRLTPIWVTGNIYNWELFKWRVEPATGAIIQYFQFEIGDKVNYNYEFIKKLTKQYENLD